MSISRVKVWIAGDILTAADLNAEFNNILNNALALVSPLTGTLNVNSQQLQNAILELQTATQSSAAGTKGRVYYQTTEALIHVDTGIVTGGTGQNPGPGGIARVPVVQGIQSGDLVIASTFYSASGETDATGFMRLGIGSANQLLTVSGGLPAWVTPAAGSINLAGTLIGTANNADYTTTSATFVDVDATNLKTTVTIPVGAKFLLVWWSLIGSGTITGTAGNFLIQVLAAGTATASGIRQDGSADNISGPYTGFGVIANPTAGSQTISLQFRSDGAATATVLNRAKENSQTLSIPRLLYVVTN